MKALTSRELLQLWEQGLSQTPARRAVEFVLAAHRDLGFGGAARLKVGVRDALILQVREFLFGTEMKAVATCRRCHENLELSFDGRDLGLNAAADPSAENALASQFELKVDGYQLLLRPVTAGDLLAVSEVKAVDSVGLLLERCVLSAICNNQAVPASTLPPEVADRAVEKLAEADPLGDIRFEISCAACGHQQQTTFDIVSFFWNELEAWAKTLLREVHTLARAYGWTEGEILSLSPMRRRLYLECVVT